MPKQRINVCVIRLALAATCVGMARAEEHRSLDGQWRFRLDDRKVGFEEKWYAGPLDRSTTIKLPGTMDDAGLGRRNTKPATLAGP